MRVTVCSHLKRYHKTFWGTGGGQGHLVCSPATDSPIFGPTTRRNRAPYIKWKP